MLDKKDIIIKALESFPGIKVTSLKGNISGLKEVTIIGKMSNISHKLLKAANVSGGSFTTSQNIEPIIACGKVVAHQYSQAEPITEMILNINPGFYRVLGEELDKEQFRAMNEEADKFINEWLKNDA